MSDRLARNAFYLTLSSIGQRVVSFVYFLLLARVLQPERIGRYWIALALVGAFHFVADLGTPSFIVREIAKDPAQALPLARRTLALKLPATLVALAAANAAAWLLGYEAAARWLVLLAGIALFIDSLNALFYAVLRGLHLLVHQSIGAFTGQLLVLTAGGLVLAFHPSLTLLVLVLPLGSLVNLAISAGQVGRRLGWKALVPSWTLSGLVQIFALSLPFFLGITFSGVSETLDVQLIKIFWGNAVVGVFSVATRFTFAFQFLPLSFTTALVPGMSALVGRRDQAGLATLFENAVRYLLLLAVPLALGIGLVAPDAVRLVGASYDAAVPVLSLLPLVLIPIFLSFATGALLNATGRQYTQTALVGVTLLASLLLELWLVPAKGMTGAAIGSIVSMSLLAFGGFLFVPHVIPDYRLRRVARLALPIVASGLAMLLAGHGLRSALARTSSSPVLRVAVVVAGSALAYAAVLLVTRGLHADDLRMLLRLARGGSRGREPTDAISTPRGDADIALENR